MRLNQKEKVICVSNLRVFTKSKSLRGGEYHRLRANLRALRYYENSYLSSESDINILIRGVRLILKMAHSEPLNSQLEFRYGNTNKEDYFWLCDQDPDTVHSLIIEVHKSTLTRIYLDYRPGYP